MVYSTTLAQNLLAVFAVDAGRTDDDGGFPLFLSSTFFNKVPAEVVSSASSAAEKTASLLCPKNQKEDRRLVKFENRCRRHTFKSVGPTSSKMQQQRESGHDWCDCEGIVRTASI